MTLEERQDAAFFFFRLFGEGAFGALTVVGRGAGLDAALLRQGHALHMEGLVGGAFDDAVLLIENFYRQVMGASINVAQGKYRARPRRARRLAVEQQAVAVAFFRPGSLVTLTISSPAVLRIVASGSGINSRSIS